MMCDTCKYLARVTGFPDGEDMPVCECPADKVYLVPFDMDEDTVCPVYEKEAKE